MNKEEEEVTETGKRGVNWNNGPSSNMVEMGEHDETVRGFLEDEKD